MNVYKFVTNDFSDICCLHVFKWKNISRFSQATSVYENNNNVIKPSLKYWGIIDYINIGETLIILDSIDSIPTPTPTTATNLHNETTLQVLTRNNAGWIKVPTNLINNMLQLQKPSY